MGHSYMSLSDAVESRPVQGRRQASSTIPFYPGLTRPCPLVILGGVRRTWRWGGMHATDV